MSGKSDMKLIDGGVRLDGRKPDELREIRMKVGVLDNAQGSAYLEWGNNKVLAGVYGPREMHPKRLQNPTEATVRVTYNMAPFSVDDRKRPGPDRRSVEISKICSEALTSVVQTHMYPNAAIDVFVEILQADAGTRCAGLTAASIALADAGIPMKDLVASCAAGKIGEEVVVDLMKEEDNYGEADVPLAIVPRTGDVVLLQMDGKLSEEEFNKAFDLAYEGCMKVYEIQKKALSEVQK
ncbi:MAG: exosome complex exonuclease Rrp41 [Candidatus Altiarchaeales archaeon]|nr:exosome complex exonuclease Rrp41 [Candidatus Altiarchaeales archaeon]MBD3416509.1 exosome complex exonuclease Rrp41 [Candidatus Altiarchaeales archaeon]